MFNLHLSRPALIAIILFCMATISALNLSHTRTQNFAVETLRLAPWPESHWQTRSSMTGKHWQAHWRQDASSHITVFIKTDSIELVRWQLDGTNWAGELKQRLIDAAAWLSQTSRIGLAITGPINQQQVVWLLAAIEQRLPVYPRPDSQALHSSQPPTTDGLLICFANQVAFHFATVNQTLADLALVAIEPALSTQQWTNLRQSFARDLRYRWLTSVEQFDIQAQLAYHRQPPNTVAHLYRQLSAASPDDVKAWLDC